MKMKTHASISIALYYFLINAIYVFGKSPESESNSSYILSCGSSSSGTDSEGRRWDPDSNYLTSSGNSIKSASNHQDPSLPSQIPFISARSFTSQSTYSFTILPNKRHLIRFYFYPSSYATLDPDDAYFSVLANEITLLNNFSASITAKALTLTHIVREFSIVPFKSGRLNITFTPSSSHDKSYAFVNGIEIIPMPDFFEPTTLVGFNDQIIDVGSYNLQVIVRLNVGGAYIRAIDDLGLSRTWFDDSPFVFGAAFGVTSPANDSVKIHYSSDFPNFVAPINVYSTSRTMGPSAKVNQNYNLTWVFQVDANFTYIVRFHFCELQLTKVNQRVFDIFLNNQTAQLSADVIAWAGSEGVPVYKDYAIYVADDLGDKEIWVALHPSLSAKPEYYDAILNGLEIFKINDKAGNLAGPNPVPSDMLLRDESTRSFSSSGSNKNGKFVGAIAGVAASFVVIGVVCFVLYQKKNKNAFGLEFKLGNWLPFYGNFYFLSKSMIAGKRVGSSHLSTLAGGLCRHFSIMEIIKGTKNFDESEVIGVGGFGKVYRGVIDGRTKVAIKRSNPSSQQGVHEFQTEIELLSMLRHRHLVSLIGFCEEDDEMILVYDFMANGTLREHLYKTNKPPLSWKQRLEICIGAARGLHYLHTGAKYTIIHRDVKTTNILLDDKWVAKVSDFGLSKTGSNFHQTHVSTIVKGSFGYLDPEYFRRQQLTEKSDVYSFGVVLFEVLCARPVLNANLPKEQVSLADWALHCKRKGKLDEIVDPYLVGKIDSECFNKFSETAEKCLADQSLDRPTMGDVLWNLEFALQLQENSGGERRRIIEAKTNNDYGIYNSILNIEEESLVSDDTNPGAIFSQQENPKGR